MFLEPQPNYTIPFLDIPNTERFPQFTESRKRQGHVWQKPRRLPKKKKEEEEEEEEEEKRQKLQQS